MDNNYHKISIQQLLLIACISLAIPFGLHFLLKQTAPKQIEIRESNYEVGYGQDAMIQQSLDNILHKLNTFNDNVNINSKNEEPKIQWLNSLVTQIWSFDNKKKVWSTPGSYDESFRSTPSIIIGLREDGVVVWKKIDE